MAEEKHPVLRAIDALIEHAAARPVGYRLSAGLDRALALSCTAQVAIEMTRRTDRLPLLLHPSFRVSAASVDGSATKAEPSGDLVWLDLSAPARAGQRSMIEVQYAGPLPEEVVQRKGRARWVELASTAFWYPWVRWTWDLSDLAAFAVECQVPEGMTAVSNLVGRSVRGRWRSESTSPCCDANLFLGPYVSTARRRAGVRGYARPDMVEHLPALVAQAGALNSHYAACYGDAPGDRLNLVIPPESMGGNWGREGLVVAALMRPNDPARNFSILSHELAHRWWGLGVRLDFLTDLWLAEGLTEFSALRARLALRGEKTLRARLGTMEGYHRARRTGIPLVECRHETPESEHLREQGGSVFLTHLRRRLGPTDFDRRLRRFYQEHTGATVTTADFTHAMVAGAPPGTKGFLQRWITSPLPEVTVEEVVEGLR